MTKSSKWELSNCELYGLILEGLEGDLNVSNIIERFVIQRHSILHYKDSLHSLHHISIN
jgi:hypothetical protein